MRDNIEGIDVFVASAEAGSFARAADRLALTRSAVGKTIARLEERLGVRLFHRTTRSQSLTEQGQIYYERCLRALAELRMGQALLESGRRDVVGKVRISMPVLFGRHCIQPILLDLAVAHPGLELDLRYSDHVVDIIHDGYDLVIRNHTPGAGRGLASRMLARQSKVVCASPAYLERRGAPLRLEDLPAHDALVYWHKGHKYPWTFRAPDGAAIEADLTWRLQFDNYEAMTDAALKGMGLACLPDWLVREPLQDGRLVAVLEDIPSDQFETYAVWPTARFLPLRITAVLEGLVKGLQWMGGD